VPWVNEQRFRRGKRVDHDTDPGRYRVHCTHAALHYESQFDSGNFDTEVDLTPQNADTSRLGGITTATGYEFGYQDRAPRSIQKPMGAVGFGGRKGEAFLNLLPARLGYLNGPARSFQDISTAPVFGQPVMTVEQKLIGIGGNDPSQWLLNAGATIDLGPIWQDGLNKVNYSVRLSGGRLEPIFTVDAWRDWITRTPPRDRAADTSFGVLMALSLNDIARLSVGSMDRNRLGDDFSWSDDLVFRNSSRQPLAHIGAGQVFVPNRGGRVDIVKRIWRDNAGQWWFFMGANVAQMQRNLLLGQLIIDPPIDEESIAANADDASENAGTMQLQGNNDTIYIGGYTQYSPGFIFQGVPIGNGDTITTATLEPRQQTINGTTAAATLAGIDEDSAAAFTTTANDLTGRADTAATVALTNTDFPGNGNRASWDVATIVGQITTRGGWESNNRLGFTAVVTSSNSSFVGFNDYNGGAANACNFNADVTAGDVLQAQVWM